MNNGWNTQYDRELLSILMNVSDGLIVVLDLAGRIVRLNRTCERITGYTESDACGQFLWDFLTAPADRDSAKAAFEELCINRLPITHENHWITRHGNSLVISWSDTTILDSENNPTYVVCTGVDITECKWAEENFSHMAFMVESSDDAIIGKTLDGVILNWNIGAQQTYGYSALEVIGKSIGILVPPDRQDELPDYLKRIRCGERIHHYETERIRKDGQRIFVSIAISPIQNKTGQLIGVSTISRDISDKRKVEEALHLQAEELARSNAELEQFAYVASHDLQEPLRMVASYVQLLARRYQGRLDADADDFITFAVDGANRMQQLINDLLALSRVGSQPRAFISLDLSTVLDTALANLQVSIRDACAIITADPLPTVQADPQQMVQLFQNLIGNAIKFRGSSAPRVHISADSHGKEWRLAFRDNGIGVSPEFYERIFVIFQRLHSRADYPGTGIGLAICRKIVERHGGRIWVESTPGYGTTFFVTMPMKRRG